jgi:hypothetical protein
MRYIILEDSSRFELQRMVEKHLAEGWRLQGGVSMVLNASFWYCQAMVKE